jgi:hypothetical protein
VDSFQPKSAQKCPAPSPALLTLRPWQDWRTFRAPEPSLALMEWLWRLIPPGALVVPLLARIPEGSKDYPLDRYSARGVPCLPDAADPPLPQRDRRAQHAALLKLLPTVHQREPERQAPRKGIPRWALEAAFYRDLVDLSTIEIADALDLRDDASRNGESGSRSARRYATDGRLQLRALGAWPWALSTDKRALLPRGWHRDQRFAAALADWHHAAVTAALRDSLRSVEAAAGSTDRSLSASVHDAAETAYRTVYEHHTAATAPED